jgi:hypothetical protein
MKSISSIYDYRFTCNLNNLYHLLNIIKKRRITLLKSVAIAISIAILLGACSSSPPDPSVAQKEQSELLERCRQLQQDIEDLKGKPVRRNAAREYYVNECTNRVQSLPSSVN